MMAFNLSNSSTDVFDRITTNGNIHIDVMPFYPELGYIVFSILVIIGFILNMLVLISFICNEKMRLLGNILHINLTASDFCSILNFAFRLTIGCVGNLETRLTMAAFNCHMFHFTAMWGLYAIAAICVIRVIKFKRPDFAFTKRSAIIAMASTLVFPVLYVILMVLSEFPVQYTQVCGKRLTIAPLVSADQLMVFFTFNRLVSGLVVLVALGLCIWIIKTSNRIRHLNPAVYFDTQTNIVSTVECHSTIVPSNRSKYRVENAPLDIKSCRRNNKVLPRKISDHACLKLQKPTASTYQNESNQNDTKETNKVPLQKQGKTTKMHFGHSRKRSTKVLNHNFTQIDILSHGCNSVRNGSDSVFGIGVRSDPKLSLGITSHWYSESSSTENRHYNGDDESIGPSSDSEYDDTNLYGIDDMMNKRSVYDQSQSTYVRKSQDSRVHKKECSIFHVQGAISNESSDLNNTRCDSNDMWNDIDTWRWNNDPRNERRYGRRNALIPVVIPPFSPQSIEHRRRVITTTLTIFIWVVTFFIPLIIWGFSSVGQMLFFTILNNIAKPILYLWRYPHFREWLHICMMKCMCKF